MLAPWFINTRAGRPCHDALNVSQQPPMNSVTFSVRDYDLAATLSSGQAFRWRFIDGGWNGVIAKRWVRLRGDKFSIHAETAEPVSDWNWLTDYLQTDLDLRVVLETFPNDEPMHAATLACRGLRLLRQEPWECLASFILSSTKQIVQIQQIVAALCERFGEPIPALPPHGPAFSFPSPERLARASESELRECKMGFRAPYLLETARIIVSGKLHLENLREVPVEIARSELMQLPGVGRKIADCVLLFAYGFPTAFPVDVWVMKALRELYFPKRRPSAKRLQHFSETHFGPNAGYAQQYLFHYMRTKRIKSIE
ncbi:MAG TPA: DNA glycosylase [Verrucomicrobiae bacterium]|nr:DNA glycosylase [Verrucomicrobiae bacterium]